MRSFLMNLGVNLIVIYFAIAAYGSGANNHAQGVDWFVNQCLPSTTFVLILYFIQLFHYKTHLNYIISIEILSTITNLIACGQYAMAHKTAFIYSHYEHIMSAMFLAELAIIMGVVIRDVGIYFKHSSIPFLAWNNSTPFTSDLRTWKNTLCKTP